MDVLLSRSKAAREGLCAVERMLVNADVSRASAARAGGISEVNLWRQLKGAGKIRPETVASFAAGLLIRLIEKTGVKVVTVSQQVFAQQVELAAQKVALAASNAVVAGGNRRPLRAAVDGLDAALKDTVADHYLRERSLRQAALAFLNDPLEEGLRLGLIGAAIAVWNARPLEKVAAHG